MNSCSNISCQGISDDEDVLEMSVEENIMCGICMEDKQRQEMFINMSNPCSHTFCIECISRHVKAKVEENITVITCPEPNCKSTLEHLSCQGIIAEDVFKMWGTALFRSSLCFGPKSVNCPFKDCSKMFVEEEGGSVTATKCPFCHRLFCAQCKVPWHLGMQCEDFLRVIKKNKKTKAQKVVSWLHVPFASWLHVPTMAQKVVSWLPVPTMAQKVVSWLHVRTKQRWQAYKQRRQALYNDQQRRQALYNDQQRRQALYNDQQRRQALYNDQAFLDLVKMNKWTKCPNCKIYVEKTKGCLHITCRCRSEFCYGCGSNWRSYSCKCK